MRRLRVKLVQLWIDLGPQAARQAGNLLQRVRRLFWLLSLAAALLVIPEMDDAAQGVAAVASLIVWWSWRLRRGSFPLRTLPIEAMPLLAAALATPDSSRLTLFYYAGLCFRSLYGSPLEVTGLVVTYLAVHLGRNLLQGADVTLVQQVMDVFGFTVCASTLSMLGKGVAERDEGEHHSLVLANAASQLAGAKVAQDVYDSLVLAARALTSRTCSSVVGLFAGGAEKLELVAQAGKVPFGTVGESKPADAWPVPLADAVRELKPVAKDDCPPPPGAQTCRGLKSVSTLAYPLAVRGRLRLAVVMMTRKPLRAAAQDALSLVSLEALLALDRIDLLAELKHQEAQFRALVQNSSDLIVLVDSSGTVRYASPAITTVLGWRPAEVVGRLATSLFEDDWALPEDRSWAVEMFASPSPPVKEGMFRRTCRLRTRGGRYRNIEVVGNDLRADPDVGAIVLNLRDVTHRVRLETELRRRANHDPLTRLANRGHFMEQLDAALTRATGTGDSVAVLMMDLDDFKSLNDTCGHAAGDELLKAVAGRVQRCLRGGDFAARLGGDEFVALLEGANAAAAAKVRERVSAALGAPFEIDGSLHSVGASIGVAVTAAGGETAPELLRNADKAMYLDKTESKKLRRIARPRPPAPGPRRLLGLVG